MKNGITPVTLTQYPQLSDYTHLSPVTSPYYVFAVFPLRIIFRENVIWPSKRVTHPFLNAEKRRIFWVFE